MPVWSGVGTQLLLLMQPPAGRGESSAIQNSLERRYVPHFELHAARCVAPDGCKVAWCPVIDGNACYVFAVRRYVHREAGQDRPPRVSPCHHLCLPCDGSIVHHQSCDRCCPHGGHVWYRDHGSLRCGRRFHGLHHRQQRRRTRCQGNHYPNSLTPFMNPCYSSYPTVPPQHALSRIA
jgi:hypothetical protein